MVKWSGFYRVEFGEAVCEAVSKRVFEGSKWGVRGWFCRLGWTIERVFKGVSVAVKGACLVIDGGYDNEGRCQWVVSS